MKTQLKKNLVMLLMSGLIVITLARLGQIANAQTGDGIKVYLPILCTACNNSSNTPTATVTGTRTPSATVTGTGTPAVTVTSTPTTSSGFTLSSSAVANGGALPTDYVCDGYGGTNSTLPLAWSGAPTKTQSLALTMYTIPGPGETHWYWVLYNIPPTVTNLPKNVTGIGTLGNSFKGTVGYTAPCSQGSGLKFYTYTLYALSAAPVLTVPPAQVSRDVLLAAISDRTLATAELGVTYNFPVTGTATPAASVTTTPTSTGGATATATPLTVVLPGATPVKLTDSFGFQFTEGPAADATGNIYFSDVAASRIYKWSLNGQITLFRENSGGANGLFFDKSGNLLACEGGNRRLVSIDLQNNVTVLTSTHKNLPFNQPNDLWLDAKGGVYFSDPVYSGATLVQAGEYVYYLTPKRDNLVLVIQDMVKPNGLIGTADGKTLYVTDPGANLTYRYAITDNGNLTNKTLFVSVGGDGMTIDEAGNVYLATTTGIAVYNSSGTQIDFIAVTEQPTNVTFGGADRQTLFITARTAIYTVAMRVKGSTSSSNVTPTPTPTSGAKMNISQTLSDEAQKNTIAFDALAFMTGDMCSDTFLPPGKVADFSGFQFLRDNDPTNMGHNTDFVTIIAGNILNILDSSQIQKFVASAKVEADLINDYGYGRFPLIKAFRRQISNDFPTGSMGLSQSAVMSYSASLYKIDGQISYNRAVLFGTILRSLTTDQKAKLDALTKLNGVGNWITSTLNLTETLKGLTPDESVAVMTYASEMYSWYAGSLEADTYFCPERQGTYFGSFYMKDMPAMNNPNFTIPDNLTADMGSDFLATLTLTQAQLITNLVNIQRNSLEDIVTTREDISTQLRQLMTAETIDEAAVLALAEQYGREDGEIIYNYAVNFSAVYNSLTTAQKTQLMKLRTDWNSISCSGAYLYSAPLKTMPTITNTDFLFSK